MSESKISPEGGRSIGRCSRIVILAALALAQMHAAGAGETAPIRIVAIGASNTSGWGVGSAAAYPARLEALLRQCGYDVRVANAGVPFETTNGMLRRIDVDVPDGTRAVVIQPGGNDLRFLGTVERRTSNIQAMMARLKPRGIVPILYDPVFPAEIYQWDRIHITAEGHGWIAQNLLPEVIAAISPRRDNAVVLNTSPARGERSAGPCGGGVVRR